jgi:hypothetical protein
LIVEAPREVARSAMMDCLPVSAAALAKSA